MDKGRDRIVANPNILAGDISMLFSQTSNDKMYLYSDLVRSAPEIKTDFFMFLQNFYALVDRTSHHLDDEVDREFHDMFEDIMVFKFTEDDEDDFYVELARKSRALIASWERYKKLLKERGILDLVHQLDVEGVGR